MSYFKKKLSSYLYIFFLILVLCFIEFSTNNARSQNYIISDIKISEIYDLNFDKNKVLDEGFQEAFKILAYKLVETKDKYKFNTVSLNIIKSLVENFSISNEEFINEKYNCEIEVEFNKKRVIEFIKNKKIIPSIPKKTDVLIIPVLIDQYDNQLYFFNQNIFYEKWIETNNQYSLINYVLPSEDIEDYQSIKKYVNNIEDFDIKKLANKYNNKKYIFLAIIKKKNNLKIFSKIYFGGEKFLLNKNYTLNDIKDIREIKSIIIDIKETYEDRWKSIHKINSSISLPIKLQVNSKNFELTEKLEKSLKNFELISKFNIYKINKDKIIYQIVYNGSPIKFLEDMKLKNFNVINNNEIWLLE